MDIRQLRYFLSVLDCRSITRAAQALHVAQPALGQQIREVEEELGVALAERHSSGIRAAWCPPTPAGCWNPMPVACCGNSNTPVRIWWTTGATRAAP